MIALLLAAGLGPRFKTKANPAFFCMDQPVHPGSPLASAGIYPMQRSMINRFNFRFGIQFLFDLLPGLAGFMYGYPVRGFCCCIRTPIAWDGPAPGGRGWETQADKEKPER